MNQNYTNTIPTEEAPEEAATPDTDDSLSQLVDSVNIADELDEARLNEISAECKEGFEVDLASREEWERNLDEWTKLAMQVRETKSYPWPNASNIKYPLLSTAAMQFNARSYPSLIPSDGKVVKGKYIGKDVTGSKSEKADRVSTFMSYQFMHEMETWDEDMDRLLIMLPIVGCIFKKTFWDSSKQKIKSELILPKNLVVNNWAKSIEDAERVSEIIELSARVVEERKRSGVFRQIELGEPVVDSTNSNMSHIPTIDATTPYTFVEQHTYLDLDDDGYKEPYVVTFLKSSGDIVRIAPRFLPDDIVMNEKDEIARITPTQHYTKFPFVPNPDGSFYDIGFGVLLGPLNESVNTLINQLVDAGSLSNLQSGFIGKGLRIKMGEARFQPGEWKPVASSGDDLKKQIVPLPAKDPSHVLLELMGTLITSGKELASVAEIFVGKMPGQNTPATTTMATIEQGMKVFTAVYKRIYRALDKEFKKVYRLNGKYLNPETYVAVLDTPVGPDDFKDESYDICPGADPTAVSKTEQLMKAQGLMELLPFGALDPIEVISRVLQAQEQPNWEKLFTKEVQMSGQLQPKPDPKQMEMQMKMQAEQQKIQLQSQAQQHKMELESRSKEQQMAQQAQEHSLEMQQKAQMANLEGAVAVHKQRIFMVQEQQKAAANQQANKMQLQQKQAAHEQTMAQQKEQSKLQSQQPTSQTGKQTQSPKPSSKQSKSK